MPSVQRLILLPDRSNTLTAAIFGCLFIGAAVVFHSQLGGMVFFLGPLGLLSIGYVLATRLRPLGLPRIEIDDDGITSLALFHRRKISWSEIDGVEHRWKVVDGSEDHDIRIWLSGGMNGAGQGRRHFDMALGGFLDTRGDCLADAGELARWLSEVRSSVASGTGILAHPWRPTRLRYVVA